MAKRILAGILAISMLAGCACGISACANHEKPTEGVTVPADETAEAIESLKKQIAELQTLIKNLTDKYTEDNEALTEQIKKLQEENKKLSDRLNMLEHQNAYGYFYTLQEAYDKGLLENGDLVQIADYANQNLQFTEELNSSILNKIKVDMASELRNRETGPIKDAIVEEIYLISYYGEYNGSYVIILGNNYEIYPTEPINNRIEIDGVKINITKYEPFRVWVEK